MSTVTDERIARLTKEIENRKTSDEKRDRDAAGAAAAAEKQHAEILKKWIADQSIIESVIDRARQFVPNPPLQKIEFKPNRETGTALAGATVHVHFALQEFSVAINVFHNGLAKFYFDQIPGRGRDSGYEIDVMSADEDVYSAVIIEQILMPQVNKD